MENNISSKEIVSVNDRGGKSSNLIGKAIFVLAVVIILTVAGLVIYNKYSDAQKASASQMAEQSPQKYDEVAPTKGATGRKFDTDPPPLPGQTGQNAQASSTAPQTACADGSQGTVAVGQDGKPILNATGAPMVICHNGQIVVPALQTGNTAATTSYPQQSTQTNQYSGQNNKPVSRYSGELMLTSTTNPLAGANAATQPRYQAYNPYQPTPQAGAPTMLMPPNTGTQPAPAQGTQSPPESIGSLLTPSQTPMVTASMIGDRNMILPKGRSIDCNLSMRLISEVTGMASCVLSQNVYSDNGNVILLERGSEASGEYVAKMAQGQRRIFVLWTRIKTPNGVVINLNSPAADELGTAGLGGHVDNRWWERIGAAFLLSIVQDAIAYETRGSDTGQTSLNIYQNTSQTGGRMAEKVLESTINIKPSLYKNQGDRGTIFVARDLDFGTVYALRAK